MNKRDYKNIWVYIENDGGKAAPVSLELLCEARKLCDVMDEKLYAVLLNKFDEEDMQKICSCGIDGTITVLGGGYEFYNTDAYANAFTVLSEKYNPSTIFVGGTINGRDFAPRFAVQLNTGCTSDAMEVQYDAETGDLEFIEPAVGGKIMAVITFPELRPQVSTIRPGTFKFEPTGAKDEIEEIVEKIDFPVD
ncbi:MAG: electron transfer flavoprotein subunit alpha/FixB family protein, partial [Clostridiales bacterium]|nr:electron transfer flavoprotein subunit alpha/FixB family protein [Clostridiales bacterium]